MVGRARIIGDHIGGDQIISSAYLTGNIRLEELTAHAFESCRPDLGPTLKAGDIIVAGENFGCGSSREYGILLLKSAGISCFISKLMKQPTAGGGILGQHHPGSSTIRA